MNLPEPFSTKISLLRIRDSWKILLSAAFSLLLLSKVKTSDSFMGVVKMNTCNNWG